VNWEIRGKVRQSVWGIVRRQPGYGSGTSELSESFFGDKYRHKIQARYEKVCYCAMGGVARHENDSNMS
jgi:hypothetical protein